MPLRVKIKTPAWLKTGLILAQLDGEDRHKAYHLKVQQYSSERGSVREDIKHGLIYGSQDFVDSIKARFLCDKKDAKLPQHNSLFATTELEEILRRAAQISGVDLERIRTSRRSLADDKDKSDLMIDLL